MHLRPRVGHSPSGRCHADRPGDRSHIFRPVKLPPARGAGCRPEDAVSAWKTLPAPSISHLPLCSPPPRPPPNTAFPRCSPLPPVFRPRISTLENATWGRPRRHFHAGNPVFGGPEGPSSTLVGSTSSGPNRRLPNVKTPPRTFEEALPRYSAGKAQDSVALHPDWTKAVWISADRSKIIRRQRSVYSFGSARTSTSETE
jgi:hypothetical protein